MPDRMRTAMVVTFALTLLAGCRATNVSDCFCTLSLAFVQVVVVDTLGAPVANLAPTVTLLRTGETIVPSSPSFGAGHYTVLTDLEKSKLDPSGDTVRFTAAANARAASGTFLIDAPGICHCHIRKLSGPDTLVLR